MRTLNSSVTFDAQGGTYYLQAGSYDDAGTGAYSVSVVFTADDLGDASLSGTVFADTNGDGKQDANESGLGDWTVYLDANSNGQFDTDEVSAVSDSNGGYTFGNLFSDDYRVGQVIPDGWQQTTPALTNQLSGRVINGTPDERFPVGREWSVRGVLTSARGH